MKERVVVFSEKSKADFRRIFNWIAGAASSDVAPGYVMRIGNCSGRLGTLILADRNDPLTHYGAIAVRMIDNPETGEFMAVSANSDHELTLANTIFSIFREYIFPVLQCIINVLDGIRSDTILDLRRFSHRPSVRVS